MVLLSIRQLLCRTGLLGTAQAVAIVFSLLRAKVVALLLSTLGMGLIEAYNSVVSLSLSFGANGLNMSAVQGIAQLQAKGEKAELQNYLRLFRSWILSLALFLGGGLALCSPRLAALLWQDSGRCYELLGLSPLLIMTILVAGEQAILKGTQSLRFLALTNLLSVLLNLSLSALGYYLWGMQAILWVLNLHALLVLIGVLWCKLPTYPYEVCFSWRFLRTGFPLLRTGIVYSFASMLSAGTDFFVRYFIVYHAGVATLGLYAAAYLLLEGNIRLLFSTMEADYYPRLSAAVSKVKVQNVTINRQIDLLLTIVSPLLIVFAFVLPYLVKLFYTEHFLPIVAMLQSSLCYVFFKALTTPIAYLSLAHARANYYLLTESSYALCFALSFAVGFYYWGLTGAAWALSLSYVLYFLLNAVLYARLFGFAFAKATWRRIVLYGGIVLSCSVSLAYFPQRYHLGLLSVCFVAALCISFQTFFAQKK